MLQRILLTPRWPRERPWSSFSSSRGIQGPEYGIRFAAFFPWRRKVRRRSQTSETKGKFDISFFSKGVNFSQALRPRFTGYGLKTIPQWNTLITITVHTYMVAHKTRSSRCSFRLTPDHPILAPGSWRANPKEGKNFETHIFWRLMAKLRSYRYLCWWYSLISDVDPSSTKKRSELTDVALLESGFSQPIARTLAHRNNASQAQILRRQIWNNCAHQNSACKNTGNFFGFLLGLKRSALLLISTFQTPAGPKES